MQAEDRNRCPGPECPEIVETFLPNRFKQIFALIGLTKNTDQKQRYTVPRRTGSLR